MDLAPFHPAPSSAVGDQEFTSDLDYDSPSRRRGIQFDRF